MNASRNRILRAVIVAIAIAVVLSAVPAFAAESAPTSRGPVPTDAIVGGTHLKGLSEAEARAIISQFTTLPAMPSILATAAGATFTVDAAVAARVDVEAMLDVAYESSATAGYELVTLYSVRTGTVNSWVTKIAKAVDKKPVNALYELRKGKVRVVKPKTGRKLDRANAKRVLTDAVRTCLESTTTTPPVVVGLKTVAWKPRTVVKNLGTAIHVDISERRITLFKNGKIVKRYRCAVGTAAYPTPTGTFKIVAKRYRPTWVNPGSAWARNMPAFIPPGPRNPLGTRALNLSASGIRFHGTYKVWSIGHAASHGCMRMRRSDIEDMYDRVTLGTRVYIVR